MSKSTFYEDPKFLNWDRQKESLRRYIQPEAEVIWSALIFCFKNDLE